MRRRTIGAGAALVLAVVQAGAAFPSPASAVAAPGIAKAERGQVNERRVIAVTSQARPIVARHFGAPDAPVQVVVIGQMHGNETGGRAVVRNLETRPVPDGVGLWLITSLNPDGYRADTRANARGVDLNRNFPASWTSSRTGSGLSSGGRPASESETRGIMRFLTAEKPTAVLSFHQAYDVVDITHRRSRAAGRHLARWMGEQARIVGCGGPCHGTMTEWIDRTLGAVALTVELDASVSSREADVSAEAVLRLARWLGR